MGLPNTGDTPVDGGGRDEIPVLWVANGDGPSGPKDETQEPPELALVVLEE